MAKLAKSQQPAEPQWNRVGCRGDVLGCNDDNRFVVRNPLELEIIKKKKKIQPSKPTKQSKTMLHVFHSDRKTAGMKAVNHMAIKRRECVMVLIRSAVM